MRRVAYVFPLLAGAALFFSLQSSRASRAQQKLATANASAKTDAFVPLEQDLIGEINLARTRPAEYASYLEQLRPYFAGKEYRRPGKPALMTEEGTSALEEAIKFLRSVKPVAPLGLSTGMCAGARELVKDQGAELLRAAHAALRELDGRHRRRPQLQRRCGARARHHAPHRRRHREPRPPLALIRPELQGRRRRLRRPQARRHVRHHLRRGLQRKGRLGAAASREERRHCYRPRRCAALLIISTFAVKN